MRTLLVMRHAKSSWSTGLPDHDRPLNARGRRDVPRVAQALLDLDWVPELVLCSDAERTRETLAFLEDALQQPLASRITPRLYLADLRMMLGVVAEAPDDVSRLMVLGHNPGCEDLVLHLTGDEVPLTTANVARLVAEHLPWAELVARPLQFRLEGLVRPKELGDA